MKQAFPAYGPDQLQQYLQKSARDMGRPAWTTSPAPASSSCRRRRTSSRRPARALASKGRAGKTVKLLSAVADNEGAVSVVEQVKRNGKVVKTIRRPGSVVATSPKTVATPWTGACQAEGIVPALRRCRRRGREQEPRELREDRPAMRRALDPRYRRITAVRRNSGARRRMELGAGGVRRPRVAPSSSSARSSCIWRRLPDTVSWIASRRGGASRRRGLSSRRS